MVTTPVVAMLNIQSALFPDVVGMDRVEQIRFPATLMVLLKLAAGLTIVILPDTVSVKPELMVRALLAVIAVADQVMDAQAAFAVTVILAL